MSVKLFREFNPLPGYFDHGVVYVRIGDTYREIPVGKAKTLSFTESLVMYQNTSILAYFVDDRYKLLLWINGTGTILTIDNYVISTFIWDVPKWLTTGHAYNQGGTVKSKLDGTYHAARLLWLDDYYHLSVDGLPISKTFKDDDPDVQEYLKLASKTYGYYPPMKIVGDDLVLCAEGRTDELVLLKDIYQRKAFTVL